VSARYQMHMPVHDSLARRRTIVDPHVHRVCALLQEVFAKLSNERPERLQVGRRQGEDARQMVARYDQRMAAGQRVTVEQRDGDVVRAEDSIRRDRAEGASMHGRLLLLIVQQARIK